MTYKPSLVVNTRVQVLYLCSLAAIRIYARPKSDILLVFEFPLLLNALYLQLVFTDAPFSLNDVVVRLPMYIGSVFMQLNCNFVTIFKLTER